MKDACKVGCERASKEEEEEKMAICRTGGKIKEREGGQASSSRVFLNGVCRFFRRHTTDGLYGFTRGKEDLAQK